MLMNPFPGRCSPPLSVQRHLLLEVGFLDAMLSAIAHLKRELDAAWDAALAPVQTEVPFCCVLGGELPTNRKWVSSPHLVSGRLAPTKIPLKSPGLFTHLNGMSHQVAMNCEWDSTVSLR